MLRRLTPVKVADLIETLAEHAIDTNLLPEEVTNQFEKRYLEIVLDLQGGNQVQTSKRLGMHRNTLARHIERLGIERKGYTVKHGNRGTNVL